MTGSYDAKFVVLSVLVGILASYVALDLAGRVKSEPGSSRLGWLAAGSIVLGFGIWGMHFIGMRAFHLGVPISYDIPLVVLSVLVAIAGSLVGLMVVGRPLTAVLAGGITMGGAIAGMHYIGMASMRVEASRTYVTPIVAVSVLIAMIAAASALWLVFRFRSAAPGTGTFARMASAAAMGIAIAGMHYTGMAAARFAPGGAFQTSGHYMLASGRFGEAVVALSVMIVGLAVVGAAIDWNMQTRATFTTSLREQAGRLSKSEQQYRLLFDHNPNPMWVYSDATRQFLAVNEAAIGRYGYSQAEFLSMTRSDIRVQPEPPQPGEAERANGAAATNVWSGRHRKKDGSILDIEATSRPIAFDGQDACLSLAIDVTNSRRAKEALRQSEQRTRLIIDTALDAVVSMNSSGVVTDWSAQAERMFGWSRGEAIGRPMSETIVPERYREAHNRGLKKFLATGEGPLLNKRIEVVALSRDGREFPIELAISPAKVGEGWTFNAFIRDLTERKKIEEGARLNEQRYRELFEELPVGLYRSTPGGVLIDVNPAMVTMLGYPSREALLATSASSLYADPRDRLRWTAQLAGDGVVLDFDVRMQCADGKEIWVRDTTHVKRGLDGAVILYEGVLEDITDRVENEQAVQASERRLVQILEAAPLGIMVTDVAGSPVFANAWAKTMLGVGIVPGTGLDTIAQVYQAYLAGTDQFYPIERMPLVRALTGEVAAVDDMEIRQGDKVVSLHVQGAPLLDNTGKVLGAVVAFFDATEKRGMEAQLRQASKMEAVGQLAGGVAHDFNNLLTVIMSYSAMLLDDVDPATALHADLREIAAAADRAAGLTRQLLAFSRQQVMQPRVLDINAVIGDVEKMLARIIGEDIELRIRPGPDVARINADPGQLEQVLMNLVVNARDAMPAGGRLTITTANAELSTESAMGALQAPDGEYVMLSVSDTGTGMAPEVQQRLFDPFFTTKDQGRGTGLGLSTVYGIVKQSGGEINVYSEVGQGSTFNIYFPRFTDTGEVVEPDTRSTDVPAGSETLLIVEDDANLRNLVARVLTDCGYTVFAATGGAEALAIASRRETPIDAVISDVVMSGMNGREVVEKLLDSRPGMGVLLMSGYTDDDVLRRGVMHGETAFLQKPFTPDQLARKVRDVLDRTLVSSVALKV